MVIVDYESYGDKKWLELVKVRYLKIFTGEIHSFQSMQSGISACRFCNGLNWVTRICCVDQQKEK